MSLNDLLDHFLFHRLVLVLIASLTYLIPNSQDLIKSFPHDIYVVIAEDKVQPVPCVFFELYFLFLKICKSDFLFIKISSLI